MEMITVSKMEYSALLNAKEELEDLTAYDRARADVGDSLPHEFMVRLIDGDNALEVFRQWRGYNQSELSRLSSVNRVQIADIESGRKSGSVKTLKKLAQALAITIDDLV